MYYLSLYIARITVCATFVCVHLSLIVVVCAPHMQFFFDARLRKFVIFSERTTTTTIQLQFLLLEIGIFFIYFSNNASEEFAIILFFYRIVII